MTYLSIKALHIAAVIVWTGGMLLAPVVIAHIQSSSDRTTLAMRYRRWYRLTTDAGITVAWLAGLWMIYTGGWWPDRWLIAKLVLVTALSSLHGMFSAQLRRLENDPDYSPPNRLEYLAVAQIALLCGTVGLVVLKP